MQEAQILFEGRVQGVGFRYRALRTLEPMALPGYVRNLRDGRVELVLQGASAEIEGAVDQLRQELGTLIRSESWSWRTPARSLDGFMILPTALNPA